MTVKAPADHAPAFPLGDTVSAIASARRAAVADRYAIDSFKVEWRALPEMHDIADEWRDLAARALSPNVFYEPAFALAAATPFGHDIGAVLVWSGGQPRKLLGFFPARIETRRYGLKLPVLVGWTHRYGPLGTPLIEREAAEPVIAAWLAHLAGDPDLPGLLLLPVVPLAGPFTAALWPTLRRMQMSAADLSRHSRAMLAPPRGGRIGYIGQALGPRRLKELRRIGRRLADLGAVLFTTATEPVAVTAAFEDFLAAEVGGWKGKAGTAALLDHDISDFMQTALAGLAAEDKAAIHRILIDGRTIAAAITLRSAGGAWFWKIAYDEDFARYSPGVLLTIALSEELLEDNDVIQADSCATPNHPMIDRIWRERLALCDVMIAVRPQAPFATARRLEALRSALITAARDVRARLPRY